jgi:hypothetical protein
MLPPQNIKVASKKQMFRLDRLSVLIVSIKNRKRDDQRNKKSNEQKLRCLAVAKIQNLGSQNFWTNSER